MYDEHNRRALFRLGELIVFTQDFIPTLKNVLLLCPPYLKKANCVKCS